MNTLIQLAMALIGTIGFSMMCSLRPRLIFVSSLGGMACWAAFLVAERFMPGVFMPSLAASAFAAVCAEQMARTFKAPATIFLVPAIIVLVPGSSLFYTMSWTVRRQWEMAGQYGYRTIGYVLGISIGVSIVLALYTMIGNLKRGRGK